MQVSRFGPAKTQVWTPQNVQVSRFGPPKRAGLQVCRFGPRSACTCGPREPQTLVEGPARFDPGRLAKDLIQTWRPARLGGPNLETCTLWGVQTWKPARLAGPNLETCPQGKVLGSRNISEGSTTWRASVCLGLSGFLEPNRTEPKTHRTARNRNRRTNRTATNRRPANRNEPNRTGTLLGLGFRV